MTTAFRTLDDADVKNKRVLVRVLGPSLAAAGVAGVLADPSVQVINAQGQTVDSNDSWKTRSTAEQSVIVQSTYAPTNDREAALIVTLSPGAYTAVVRGAGGATGVALVEAYDLDATGAPRMINLSTRAKIGTGDNVVIGGFVVTEGVSRVRIRGLGPSLSNSVGGTVSGTSLAIMDSQGRTVTSAADWAANPAQADAIRATGRAPANARESAIVAELPAGAYTAILRGGNGSTGIGLVEIYELR